MQRSEVLSLHGLVVATCVPPSHYHLHISICDKHCMNKNNEIIQICLFCDALVKMTNAMNFFSGVINGRETPWVWCYSFYMFPVKKKSSFKPSIMGEEK